MQNLQRSTSHTGVSNAQSWGSAFARSNTLHHVDRQGRGSQGDNSEKYELITKDTLNSIFQAIQNEDLLALTNLYHGIERLALSQLQLRRWFIQKSKKDNQTPLIAAACKGNLDIVKLVLETMFIGKNVETQAHTLEEEVEINDNLLLASCDIDETLGPYLLDDDDGLHLRKLSNESITSRGDTNSGDNSIFQNDNNNNIILENFDVSTSNACEPVTTQFSTSASEVSLPSSTIIKTCGNKDRRIVPYVTQLAEFLEVQGTIVCDEDQIEGSSALWAAASFGHADICRYLIRKGASVHTRTQAGSTPLRCACYDGHLETVKILVFAGADIEAANKHGHTCLMIACYRGQEAVVKYLIDQGVDVNKRGRKGNTALHDSAEKGSLQIFKMLLANKGDITLTDKDGQTALIAAAISGSDEVIDYAESVKVDDALIDRSALIEAKELLGCYYIDKKRNYRKALTTWKDAITMRMNFAYPKENGGRNCIRKTIEALKATVKSFNWDELDCPIKAAFPTVDEFNSYNDIIRLTSEPSEIRHQAQLVRFRILGPQNPECTVYLRTRGAQVADQGDWERCSKIWLVTMLLHSSYKLPICGATIQHFVASIQLFQHMLAANLQHPVHNKMLSFRNVVCTVEGAFYECQRYALNGTFCEDDIQLPEDRVNKMLRMALLLTSFALMCRVEPASKFVDEIENPELLERLRNCVLKQKNLRNPEKMTLLHLASSESIKSSRRRLDAVAMSNYDDDELLSAQGLPSEIFHMFKKWIRLPNIHLVQYLLDCGHDADILDNEGNTPLHIACRQRSGSNLIAVLVKAGANPFQENKHGRTAFYHLKRALTLKEVNPKVFF